MVLKLLAKLPLSALYGLSYIGFVIVFYLVRYRRETVYQNLKNSFPGYREAELRAVEKQVYKNFLDVAVETIKAIDIDAAELIERVHITNPELIEEHIKKGQSVIVLAAHQCNWEWLLLAACQQLSLPFDVVYKPLHNKKINELIFTIRARFGALPIAHHNAVIEIMKRRKTVRGFAMVADQTPLRREEKYWTTWLNQDTAFAVGAAKIAKITKYPVLFVGMKRIKRGYYEAFFKKLGVPPYDSDGYAIIEHYVRETERQIKEAPADWLWTHRKWKYKKPLYS